MFLYTDTSSYSCSAAPKSESEAASPNSSSPVRQSNSNPFARKSVGSPAPSPLNVSPSPAPVNPFAKGGVRSSGGRSSGLTISAAVGALTISPPSSASSVNGSARNGSDPAIIPPPTQSPLTTKSNASTPRLTEKQRSDRDAAHVRRGSGSSEDGTIKRITGSRERDKRIQHLTEDPDITPRSHHGTARTAISNSASTSNLPPTRFNFEEQEKKKRPGSGTEASHSSEASQPTQTSQFEKWRCENPKCLKWNAGNPDYCDFCAIRRGATGARGNAAKLYLDQHH